MRWLPIVVLAGGTAALALHGCGLGVVGVAPEGEGLEASVSNEASTSVPSEAGPSDASIARDGDLFTPVDAAGCGCALVAPAGWSLVAYGDRTATCPGDLASLDLVTDPVAPDACGCTCSAAPPTCNATQWNITYDESSTARCDVASPNRHDVTTGCIPDNGFLVQHTGLPTLAPQSAGTCTATAVKKPDGVTSTPVRVCQQKGATCACGPGLGANLTTCLAANGDQACPPSAPKKHLVAASADVDCGACGCTAAGTCKQTATFYSDQSCQVVLVTVSSDACSATQNNAQFKSIRHQIDARPACTPGPAPVGTPRLVEPSTICCPS